MKRTMKKGKLEKRVRTEKKKKRDMVKEKKQLFRSSRYLVCACVNVCMCEGRAGYKGYWGDGVVLLF